MTAPITSQPSLICRFPALLLGLLLLTVPAWPAAAAQSAAPSLAELKSQREQLTAEMRQYDRTVELLHRSGTELTDYAATIERLQAAVVRIRRELIRVSEAEVELLRQQRNRQTPAPQPHPAVAEQTPRQPETDLLPPSSAPPAPEGARVEQLLGLINRHYRDLEAAAPRSVAPARAQPDPGPERQRPADQKRDPVLLTGHEGSAALERVTRRLADPQLPERRHELPVVCSVRTHIFGTLIASENRSLRPVGKGHYVGQLRLQPGDSTIRVNDDRWRVRRPETDSARDYLVVLHSPLGGSAGLKLIDLADLQQLGDGQLPPWWPQELALSGIDP